MQESSSDILNTVSDKKRINSKQKGKRGEQEWVNKLKEEGFLAARRGQQFCGANGDPDVIVDCLPNIHFEVKFTNRLDLYGAINQAKNDCGTKIPIVAHRRSHSDWVVAMRAEDWFSLLKESNQIVRIFCKGCGGTNFRKDGKDAKTKQRYECLNEDCGVTFSE